MYRRRRLHTDIVSVLYLSTSHRSCLKNIHNNTTVNNEKDHLMKDLAYCGPAKNVERFACLVSPIG